MTIKGKSETVVKFLIYFVVVVLLNIAGLRLFYRVDLTEDGLYSLSEDSRQAVSDLSEPLTIKVFFTRNLPAPHNGTEQYLHDLLEEYALYANRYFNYRFYNVSTEIGDMDAAALENQKQAKEYGIHPVQIQHIEKDEIKFQKAYMGMVLINGDLVERIPTITDTDGLEYRITSAIRKLNNKVSALLRLKEPIDIRLYLSSSLKTVAPYIRLTDIDGLPEKIEEIVGELNSKHFGKLKYSRIDPSSDIHREDELRQYNVMYLKWPEIQQDHIPAGKGAIGLVMIHGEKAVSIPLINVMRLPLIGTRYSMVDINQLSRTIEENIESLININEDIGYLVSHQALSPSPPQAADPMAGRGMDDISFFRNLLSRNYTIKDVDLKKDDALDTFNCLIIGRPLDPFTDYELFKIDQFLMRGKSLAVFLDAFKEVTPPGQQMMMNRGSTHVPVKTGLEKLLAHYGIEIKPSFVMDKNCYNQQIQTRFGGGERPIYFAPIIQNENIAHDLDFMKNIKGLVVMKASPLLVKDEYLEQNDIIAHKLFSSSPESWEMTAPVNLMPMMIHPPISEDKYNDFALAYLLEGSFPSYFADKPIPEKKTGQEQNPDKEEATKASPDPALPDITGEGMKISKGQPGRIFLVASSELLKNNLLDEEGKSANATFLLNVIDALNGRNQTAVMRSKEQRFNPLYETGAGVKTFVKSFNIAGLPIMVVIFGIIVWFARRSRKKRIRMIFKKSLSSS